MARTSARRVVSAGLLMCRFPGSETAPQVEVLLGHPGGPFFARKDAGAWCIPKGLLDDGEDALAAARREFVEETGFSVAPEDDAYLDLGEVRTSKGKIVRAWAFAGDAEPSALDSNTFDLEWPPRSGRRQRFPELDRAAWFDLGEAADKIVAYQRPFLDRLGDRLDVLRR